jgi:Peptidase family M23
MSAKRAYKVVCLMGLLLVLSGMASRVGEHPAALRFPMEGAEFLLSGTFGELRPNHFHAGLDIKTGGETGRALLATREGYVYRIKVSPIGYGHAVYLRHPDGYFSVYGHMSCFSPDIEALVEQQQFSTKRYEQEIYLSEEELPVRTGQLIGYSGNSGSSQGAHLHFEVRDEQERAINPLAYFKSLIRDDVPPVLQALALQPLGVDARVQGRYQKLELAVGGKGGSYSVEGVVQVEGPVGLEYQGYDLLSGAANHCGINQARLSLDGSPIWELRLERLGFEEKKYINLHYDFGHHKRTGRKFERCYRAPGNSLEIYPLAVQGGRIELRDQRVHQLRLELTDLHGNTTVAQVQLQRGRSASLPSRLSYPELTTLSGEELQGVYVAKVCHPSSAHLGGIEAVLPGDGRRRVPPAWFEGDCLYYLFDLRTGELPEAIRDPYTGKTIPFYRHKRVLPQRSTKIEEGELQVYFPAHAVFDTLPVQVRQVQRDPGMYSDIYEVGHVELPLRGAYSLGFRPRHPGRPEHLVVASRDILGRWSYLGNEWNQDGALTASASSFGAYCVMADSVPPVLSPLNFSDGGSIPSGQDRLSLQVKDSFSGIDAQRLHGTIDGRWVLFEYDAKNNQISHPLKQRPTPGTHSLELFVYDRANNLSAATFSLSF